MSLSENSGLTNMSDGVPLFYNSSKLISKWVDRAK